MILSTEEVRQADRLGGVPGQQGGPLEHIIAGKAVALKDRSF